MKQKKIIEEIKAMEPYRLSKYPINPMIDRFLQIFQMFALNWKEF